MTRFTPRKFAVCTSANKRLETVRKVNLYFEIIGKNFAEIQEPEGGWTTTHKSCVLKGEGKFGKFFIKEDAIIDYMQKNFTIINLQNYHPSLMDLALKQLEDTCHILIGYRTRSSHFPNLTHLLTKYYGLC